MPFVSSPLIFYLFPYLKSSLNHFPFPGRSISFSSQKICTCSFQQISSIRSLESTAKANSINYFEGVRYTVLLRFSGLIVAGRNWLAVLWL